MYTDQSSFAERIASRKFVLMVMILSFSTLLLVLPITLSVLSDDTLANLMSGGEFASLIIGTYGLYVGANVLEKKVLGSIVAPDDVEPAPKPPTV